MLILTETNEPDEQEMMNYKTAVVVCTGIYIQDLQTEKWKTWQVENDGRPLIVFAKILRSQQ